jgi:hypothetical protein
MTKATSKGWVLATDVYKPNQGVFNRDPANVFKPQGLQNS